MANVKDLEGSVSVTDDITPITRRKIDQLDASKWPDMSVNELTEQRIILSNRIAAASGYGGNMSVVQQLQRGLASLDAMIAQKSAGDDEVHLI